MNAMILDRDLKLDIKTIEYILDLKLHFNIRNNYLT